MRGRLALLAWTAALLATLFAGRASAALVFSTGGDAITEDTGTASDHHDFDEVSTGTAVDADARTQATVVHDDATGGSSTSKQAFRFQATLLTNTVEYRLKTGRITPALAYCEGFALRVASGEQPSASRAIFAFGEDSVTDRGGALVLNSDRSLTLTYLGTNEGSCTVDANCDADEKCYNLVCRKVWGTTSGLLDTVGTTACSTDNQTACTTSGDCPGTSPSCNLPYWPYVEICQSIGQNASQVLLELYLNGRAIFAQTTKTLASASVGSISTWAIGLLNAGPVSSTATIYIDDVVTDDSGTRAGVNYIGRLYPILTPSGFTCPTCNNGWTIQSGSGSDTTPRSVVDDYGVNAGFTYDTDASTLDNVLKGNKPQKIQDLPRFGSSPALVPRQGEAITAVEAVVVGRTGTTGAATRELRTSLLTCPANAMSEITCTEKTGPVIDLNAVFGGPVNPPTIMQRFVAASPVSGDWGTQLGVVGVRLSTEDTPQNRPLYAGAVVVNVTVRRPDQKEGITLRDRNLGPDDGLQTVCVAGDSLLLLTAGFFCVGGSTPGRQCSQDSACSWDEFRDQPPGGCRQFGAEADAACWRCSSDVGYGCKVDGDCDLGNCSCTTPSCGGTCANDEARTCDEHTDCDLGTCNEESATCVDVCEGGGFCPTGKASWIDPIAAKVPAHNVYPFAMGAEDSGQWLKYRMPDMLLGKLSYPTGGSSACFPGVAATCGTAIQGSGVCTCTVATQATDCGASGTCNATTLRCEGNSDANKLVCASPADCNYAQGRWCQGAPCDTVMVGLGNNNGFAMAYVQAGSPIFQEHDPECDTIASLKAIAPRPVAWCPQYGTGAYQKNVAATYCSRNAECVTATGSADSECFGACYGGSAGPCRSNADCSFACTMDAPGCDTSADCTLGRTCVGGHPEAPGTMLSGLCTCTSDAQCASTHACVGDAGGVKTCRLKCTTDGNCGFGNVCDQTSCATSGRCDSSNCPGGICDIKFCRAPGVCTIPCNAIPCTDDGDCTAGFESTQRHGYPDLDRPVFKPGGICNPATGTCTCCGAVRCGEIEALMRRGCSCANDGDCGSPGGDCVDGECVAGPASDCETSSSCALGQRCLRCSKQLHDYYASHEALDLEVVKRTQAYIDSVSDPDGKPLLIWVEKSLPNGLVETGNPATSFMLADRPCTGAWGTRRDFARNRAELLSFLPARRVVDQTVFNALRHTQRLITDPKHLSLLGGTVYGNAAADTALALNVCVTVADPKVPQEYCRSANGTWATSPNNGACTTVADCASGFRCELRLCNGVSCTPNTSGCDTNCPATGDICNGDD